MTEQAQQAVQETAQGTSQGTAQETAEPLTQEQAQTEIERLQGDPDFLKVYLSNTTSDPGIHKEAVSRMHGLFALAHPTDTPVSETPRLDEKRAEIEQQHQQEQQPLSEDEQYEALLEDSSQIMQGRFGADWQDEMPDVRDSIHEIGGDMLFDHILDNHGSDPEVIGLLVNLQRENDRYPIVAAIAELVDQNMTPNAALLAIERHLADPEFVASYTDSGSRGHKANMATMRALFLAADPPAFIANGAQA